MPRGRSGRRDSQVRDAEFVIRGLNLLSTVAFGVIIVALVARIPLGPARWAMVLAVWLLPPTLAFVGKRRDR